MLKTVIRFLGFGMGYSGNKIAPENLHDHILFREDMEGWIGSGFKNRTTYFKARNVWRADLFDNDGTPLPPQEELQIELTVETHYDSGATRSTYATFSPRGDDVRRLLAHIAEPKGKPA